MCDDPRWPEQKHTYMSVCAYKLSALYSAYQVVGMRKEQEDVLSTAR